MAILGWPRQRGLGRRRRHTGCCSESQRLASVTHRATLRAVISHGRLRALGSSDQASARASEAACEKEGNLTATQCHCKLSQTPRTRDGQGLIAQSHGTGRRREGGCSPGHWQRGSPRCVAVTVTDSPDATAWQRNGSSRPGRA
jgi:hypothetical protein